MGETTVGVALAILAALVAALVVTFSRGKKTLRVATIWISGVVIVLGLVSMSYTIPFFSNSFSLGGETGGTLSAGGGALAVGDEGTAGQQPSSTGLSGLCVKTDSVTVTLAAVNKETQVATGGTHRYQLDGGRWSTIADAGTFSAAPGQQLKVLFMNASLVNNYYSSLEEFSIPCEAVFDTSKAGGRLAQNGTLTMTFYNENNDAINGNGVNLTLGSGDERTIKFDIQGQYQREHAYGVLRVLEYNRTSIDWAKVTEFNGATVSETNVPSADTPSNTGVDRKGFLLPSIKGSSTLSGSIVINVDDSINPGIESDIVVRDYSLNYYVDEQDGSRIKGPSMSDEQNTINSLNTMNSTIHVV